MANDTDEFQEFIKQADEKLAEAADTWAINTDAKFASGVRTGIRLARKIIQELKRGGNNETTGE